MPLPDRHLSACRILATLLALSPGTVLAAELSILSGQWRGTGEVYFGNGNSEKISCRVTYEVTDTELEQALRCANPRLTIDLSTTLRHETGRLSGTWEESHSGRSGQVSGSASDSSIDLRMTGEGHRSSLKIGLSGCSQTISFKTSHGRFHRVSIRLRKGEC